MNEWRWLAGIAGALLAACRITSPAPPPPAFVPGPAPVQAAAPLTGAGPVAPSTAPTNELLWQMSRDPAVVNAGQLAFRSSSCGSCHGFMLTGGTGPNLVDHGWLHGGTPREVFRTISQGVPSKGMPTWGPILGPKMVTDIVAFIFSHHQEGEPIEVQANFIPGSPSYPN